MLKTINIVNNTNKNNVEKTINIVNNNNKNNVEDN